MDVARAEFDGAPEEGIQVHKGVAGEESAGLVRASLEARQQAQRRAGKAAGIARVSDLAAEQSCDHAPHRRDARDLEGRARMTVEHELRLPRRVGEAAERRVELLLVAVSLPRGSPRRRDEPRRAPRRSRRPRADRRVRRRRRRAGPDRGAPSSDGSGAAGPEVGQRGRSTPCAAQSRCRCSRSLGPSPPTRRRRSSRDPPWGRPSRTRRGRPRARPCAPACRREAARFLERDPVDDAAAEPRVARDPPVDAVGADDHATPGHAEPPTGSSLRPVRPLDLRP